ncbi:hypothetical protein SAMN04488692_1311, partial [Halarsenatibacter silvermanii]
MFAGKKALFISLLVISAVLISGGITEA